ncbi:RNase L inhibitor protein-related isoform 1 [Hibiscus syriacus]|uniref:RNase L inhibitor protein-related isoform 1 n=1 Tax=Hibiscus syriacus TaxID=106335 RepID=A0A6A3A9K0_HIBSY|nr:RNase L inhibitor protein-related isoform 1 [Hibiscus syriacus]
MLRRSIFELSRCRGAPWRIRREIASQRLSPFIYSRKQFSTSAGENGNPKPESKTGVPNFVLGTAVISGAILIAYRAGYFEKYGKGPKVYIDSTNIVFDGKDEKDIQVVSSRNEELLPYVDLPDQKVATNIDLPQPETSSETQGTTPLPEQALPEYSQSSLPSADHSADVAASAEENLKKVESEPATVPNNEIQDVLFDTQSSECLGEKDTKTAPSPTTAVGLRDEPSKGAQAHELVPRESQLKSVPSLPPTAEDEFSKDIEAPSSLLETYHLREKADENYLTSLNRKYERLSKEAEAFGTFVEELDDGYLSKDGKLVLNFLKAIHAAEKQQAELDANAFAEEKRALKEMYEKELRDSRARELMRTEEAAILDKELLRERTKTSAAIKSLQEKMKEKIRIELEQKEREAEMKLEKALELGKAEVIAAIANEKAAQIEKMAEANLHIHALCMAFYARSEEAHKRIESIINRVENYLAEGKLAEAAGTLEQGVKGSQAEEIIGDWVKRARNRAITEQALTVLQSYATCSSLT